MKKKICFITNSHGDWGGASRVIYTLLRSLDTARIEPLLLLPRPGPIEPELRERGLRYVIWGPLVEWSGLRKYAVAFVRALRFFRAEQVALVHVNALGWRPAEVLAARALGIPVIAHFHLTQNERPPMLRHLAAAVCVSEYVARESLPPGLHKPVVYNPVDIARFARGTDLRSALGLAADELVVSFLGQIRDFKGVADFIAMAKHLDGVKATFLLAGECRDPKKFHGSYTEEELRTMIGGDTRICYLGHVSRVEDIYCTSDIVVVPSRWQEPLGLIALEAGACSKPVVATRVGGIPETVDDGMNGFLVDACDVPALADRVGRLLASRELRLEMGAAGRQRVERDFTTQPIRQFEALLVAHAR